MKPCYETDVNKLLAAKEILFRDNQSDGAWKLVTIAKCCYGGARIDRLRERNRITNGLGLPTCVGLELWCIEHGNGWSTCLADVLSEAAQGIDTLSIDGAQLWPQTGFSYYGEYMYYAEEGIKTL